VQKDWDLVSHGRKNTLGGGDRKIIAVAPRKEKTVTFKRLAAEKGEVKE